MNFPFSWCHFKLRPVIGLTANTCPDYSHTYRSVPLSHVFLHSRTHSHLAAGLTKTGSEKRECLLGRNISVCDGTDLCMNECVCVSACESWWFVLCALVVSSKYTSGSWERFCFFFFVATSLLTHIATLLLPFIPAITPFASGKDLNRSHFKARYCIYRAMMAVRGFGMICCCLVETLRHF